MCSFCTDREELLKKHRLTKADAQDIRTEVIQQTLMGESLLNTRYPDLDPDTREHIAEVFST